MFGSADAGHTVETLRLKPGKKIIDFDVTAVFQAGLANPMARHLGLLGAYRQTYRLHAVVAGGMNDQGAPTATQVEQAQPRPQAQLAADVIELGILRRAERIIRRLKIGTAVG